ncbi:MAG: autotransporter-associated beta strand repeat-containing protein, partial [Thermoguttaceae bacterium]
MVGEFAKRNSCRAARMWVAAVASFVAASVMLEVPPLRAASCNWVVSSGDWSLASNWRGTLPTGSDTAYIANGGTATITMSGELCNTLTVGGNTGSGTVLMAGGALSCGGAMKLGYTPGSIGTFALSGGQLSAPYQYVGENGGTGSFVQTGGLNTVNLIYLAEGANSSGMYSLGGTGQLTAFEEVLGDSGGSATFTQSGGVNTVTGDFILGDSPGSTGTYNLNGGTLIVPSMDSTGNPAFNFGGGTLQAGSGFSISLPMTLSASGGGATFDTAGFAVTITGSLSGPGSLAKIGSGTLTLSGSNTYSGGTTVGGGVLQLGVQAGVPDNTPLTVTAGTLDLGGFIKTTTAAVSFQGGVVQNGVIINNGSSAYDGQAGTVAASLQGTAGLSKTTGGILVLTGSNSYTGDTQITGGTLEIDGPMAASTAQVSIGSMSTLIANTSIPRAIAGLAVSSQIVANTANVSLGDFTSNTGFTHAGTLIVGSNTVTLNSTGSANLGVLTTLGGGTLSAPNGVTVPPSGNFIGFGAVNGKLAAGYGSTISATGNLTLGDPTSPVGFVSGGQLYTNANTVTLNSSNGGDNQNAVVLGSLTQIDGGSLVAPNGILLNSGNILVTTDAGGTVSGGTASQFLN